MQTTEDKAHLYTVYHSLSKANPKTDKILQYFLLNENDNSEFITIQVLNISKNVKY